MRKTILGAFLAATLMVLTACGGEVITPQPTSVMPLVSTSTPAPTPTLRPTATAPFLPPVATATSTITPTPIAHVVQEGETLLSIAYEYGVSVQALQAVNGIENPLLLQVGQRLIIPIGEEATEITPGLLLPTPTPLPFDVQGVAFYETPVGSLECLGEVVNTTAFTLTNVLVRVTLYDDAGAALMTVTGCLTLRETYRAIDRRTILLLAGMISMGLAMERSGAAAQLAHFVMDHASGLGPWFLLVATYVATAIFTALSTLDPD